MESVIFKLKDKQTKTTPAKQKETLLYLVFSYGYYEIADNSKKKYINLKYSTGLKILPKYWNVKTYRAKQTENFDYQSFNIELDNIENTIKQIYRINKNATPNQLRELLKNKDKKETTFTFNQYIKHFINGIENGTILKIKGGKYTNGSVKSYKAFQSTLDNYQKAKKITLDFNDITLEFYNQFVVYLNSKDFSQNYIGKQIKDIKAIMNRAFDLGYHKSQEYKRQSFKKVEEQKVFDIYLNKDELVRFEKINLSKKPHLDIARDIFLVGCYTAQRYSDYSKISKANIKANQIELTQQKTKEQVIIPISSKLRTILEKYNYQLPKTYEQKVNKYIKEIGELAKIDELIEIQRIKGGKVTKKEVEKYKLIKTHTARRTGATLMYLANIPTIDIMKFTGHQSTVQLLKYIKVSKQETATKLSSHPYFK